MKRHTISALLALLLLMLAGTLVASDHYLRSCPYFYTLPVEPDSTKLVYPIPVATGNPMDDLYNQSPLYLKDPANMNTEIFYDPVTKQYTFKKKVGDFFYDVPMTMSEEEYARYQDQKGIQEYWKQRRSQNSRSTTDGSSIIPPIFIGGKAFETIFGSNTVDIRPQGSVDLTFGVKHNYRGDHSLTRRRQHHTDFIFDQDIQLNVMAKIGDKINFNINKNTKRTPRPPSTTKTSWP